MPSSIPYLTPRRVSTEKPSVVSSSVGTFLVQAVKSFYYKRSLKNTAPHLPWYAAYVILHERKTANRFYYDI